MKRIINHGVVGFVVFLVIFNAFALMMSGSLSSLIDFYETYTIDQWLQMLYGSITAFLVGIVNGLMGNSLKWLIMGIMLVPIVDIVIWFRHMGLIRAPEYFMWLTLVSRAIAMASPSTLFFLFKLFFIKRPMHHVA